jgi:T5orf172 domain
MISRKKRARYIKNAYLLAKEQNISIDLNDWEQVWNLLDKFDEPEYVYAIQDGNNNIKIGKSVNPHQRMHSLQTAHGTKLVMLGYTVNQLPLEEKALHKRLKKDRLEGEWFKPSVDVMQVVKEIIYSTKRI